MRKLTLIKQLTFAKLVSRAPSLVINAKALLLVVSFSCLTHTSMAVGEVHEAHLHGVANLTLVFENNVLEVKFESPAISLLGFENSPKTKQQIETIKTTTEILNSPEKVLSINGANCTASEVNVEIHGPAGQALQGSEEHEHHESNEEQDDHDAIHSELIATYRFDCVGGEKIRSVALGLFEIFPNLESIKANWVTESQQGQSILRSNALTIELR